MRSDGLPQSWGSAQCGLMAIVNALDVLFGEVAVGDAGRLQAAMARALEGTGGRDLAGVLFEHGTGRRQLGRMLKAARTWTDGEGWLPWSWRPMHPVPGQAVAEFWSDKARALESERAALVVGFGGDTDPNTPYVPHWTCVERVTPRSLDLRDSAGYGVVPISHTGIRPGAGWQVQDCFALWRSV
jgi:hypothetical protein